MDDRALAQTKVELKAGDKVMFAPLTGIISQRIQRGFRWVTFIVSQFAISYLDNLYG